MPPWSSPGRLIGGHHVAGAVVQVRHFARRVLVRLGDHLNGLGAMVRDPILALLHTMLLLEVVRPQRFSGGPIEHLDGLHISCDHVRQIGGDRVPLRIHGELLFLHFREFLLREEGEREQEERSAHGGMMLCRRFPEEQASTIPHFMRIRRGQVEGMGPASYLPRPAVFRSGPFDP